MIWPLHNISIRSIYVLDDLDRDLPDACKFFVYGVSFKLPT